MEDVGKRVRKLRRDKELSQQALAEMTGMTYQAINRLEKGHTTPRLTTVDALAKALAVDPKWLAFGNGDPEGGKP